MLQIAQENTIRLTRRGQIMKQAKQVYLSDDIPCQIKQCGLCPLEQDPIDVEDCNEVFFLDTDILSQQIDIIEQAPTIKNIVILQTQMSYLKNKCCYVYPDEFSTVTQSRKNQSDSQARRIQLNLIQLVAWYQQHCKLIKSPIQIKLLTTNYDTFKCAKELQINVETLHDYIKDNCGEELLDFLGMEEEEEEDNDAANVQEYVQKIKQGLLFEGKLSVDRNDITQARIIVRQFNLEIKIDGTVNQNRALHGDRVAIQLLGEKEWKKEEQKRVKFEDEDDEHMESETKAGTSAQLNDVGQLQDLFRKIQKDKLQPYGRVVGVLQRVDKQFGGHVVDSLFYPADARYPTFKLRSQRINLLQDKKVIVEFTRWPQDSEFPLCRLKKILGQAGDMTVEGNLILHEHQVETREFSQQDKYEIPSEERARRWDLRNLQICSIDPVGCRDIDDALHCRVLENGRYEVGVHIADVSYFVRPDTAIDKEAAHRCTTVYLVDRRTDMLPKLLTETLCSLVSNVDRQAFSVIWEMNEKGEILGVRFGKSIIRSCASLHYGQAQGMIDNPQDQSELTKGIRLLNMLAKQLKQKRVQEGALTLASSQVKFTFDEETHNPTDVRMYPMFETNSLVEEFMLLANVSVAEKILSRFPAISILRRHQEPKPKQIRELCDLLRSLGYDFEFDTSRILSDSLDGISRPNDPFFNKLIRILTTRCMNEALYICTADFDYPELFHYGLAAQLYTHFTSPIRRYADILVHRLLAASIDLESLPASMSNKIRMSRICDKMNMRHRNARFASRASSDYHTYLFFKNKNEKTESAVITGVTAKGYTVILPQYGLEGAVDTESKHSIFDYIKVQVEVQLKHFHKQILLRYVTK